MLYISRDLILVSGCPVHFKCQHNSLKLSIFCTRNIQLSPKQITRLKRTNTKLGVIMFVYTFPGFQGATVTKLYLYLQAVIPILVSLLSIQYLFDLQISPHLLIWRMLFSNQLVSSSIHGFKTITNTNFLL